jgi:hypothetical protein
MDCEPASTDGVVAADCRSALSRGSPAVLTRTIGERDESSRRSRLTSPHHRRRFAPDALGHVGPPKTSLCPSGPIQTIHAPDGPQLIRWRIYKDLENSVRQPASSLPRAADSHRPAAKIIPQPMITYAVEDIRWASSREGLVRQKPPYFSLERTACNDRSQDVARERRSCEWSTRMPRCNRSSKRRTSGVKPC